MQDFSNFEFFHHRYLRNSISPFYNFCNFFVIFHSLIKVYCDFSNVVEHLLRYETSTKNSRLRHLINKENIFLLFVIFLTFIASLILTICNAKSSELQLSHIHCETIDHESDSKNMLLINMLQIENEHETRVDSSYYQNNVNKSNPEEPNNNQYTKNHTPHFVENNSNKNTIYQNTRTRIQLPNEKHWTIPLLLESLKSKNFQSPDLEIDFFY